jgi:hypothetical protein
MAIAARAIAMGSATILKDAGAMQKVMDWQLQGISKIRSGENPRQLISTIKASFIVRSSPKAKR